jgi:hypothetical protein
MQTSAETQSRNWLKRPSTRTKPVEPLQEALIKAGTKRINDCDVGCIMDCVHDFIEATDDGYNELQRTERNYRLTVKKEMNEKLDKILKIVPSYERIDVSSVGVTSVTDKIAVPVCETT